MLVTVFVARWLVRVLVALPLKFAALLTRPLVQRPPSVWPRLVRVGAV